MKKVLSLVAAVIGLLSVHANAQNASSAGFYAGAEAHIGLTKDTTEDNRAALVRAVGGTATVTQDGAAYIGRFLVGYQFNENISVEAGYNQSLKFTQTFSGRSSGAVSYTGTSDSTVSGLDYSVLVRPSISTGMNGLFFRVGGHSLTGKTDAVVASGAVSITGSSSISGSGVLFGAGFDTPVSTNSIVRVSVTSLNKIAGGDSNLTTLGIGFIGKF